MSSVWKTPAMCGKHIIICYDRSWTFDSYGLRDTSGVCGLGVKIISIPGPNLNLFPKMIDIFQKNSDQCYIVTIVSVRHFQGLLAVLVDWAGAAPELNQECSSAKKQNQKGIKASPEVLFHLDEYIGDLSNDCHSRFTANMKIEIFLSTNNYRERQRMCSCVSADLWEQTW